MDQPALKRQGFRIALQGVIVAAFFVGSATPAFAAKPAGQSGGGSGGGGSSTSTATGNDVSYPQCGTSLPASPA